MEIANDWSDNVEIIPCLKFTKTHSNRLYLELDRVRQKNYTFIGNYYNHIDVILKELSVCNSWMEELLDAKREEVFYKNREPNTRIEMRRLNINRITDIYNHIRSTEEMIIEQIDAETHQTHRRTTIYHNCGREGHKQPQCRSYQNDHQGKFRKNQNNHNHYTNQHLDRNTHNSQRTDRFNTNNQQRSNTNSQQRFNQTDQYKQNDANYVRIHTVKRRNDAQGYVIKEVDQEAETPKIRININGATETAIVDTGATTNVIARSLVEKLGLKEEKLPEIRRVMLGNGPEISIESQTYCKIQLENHQEIKYDASFLIVPTTNEEVLILGMQFLFNYEVKIDICEGTSRLGNQEYELDIGRRNPDTRNIEKTEILSIENRKSQLKSPVKQARANNPKMGEISVTQHEIKFEKEPEQKFVTYQVPLKLREKTANLLEKLLKEKVIEETCSPCCSPAFLIEKKNGDLRLVVDYRKINEQR